MSHLSRLHDTTEGEALGLQEVDRVLYPVRKIFRKHDRKYQFQSPSFSPESQTLVGWSDFPKVEISSFLESIGFSGAPLSKTIPVQSDSVRAVEVIANFVRVVVHGEERPAIRIAYKLYT